MDSFRKNPYALDATAEGAEMNWISVKDQLPTSGQRVLCYSGYIYIKNFQEREEDYIFCDGDFHWTGKPLGEIEKVTHWMPLPDAPNINPKIPNQTRYLTKLKPPDDDDPITAASLRNGKILKKLLG